jgi:restriction endonuclease S subunit
VTDGIHTSIVFSEDSGINLLSAMSPKENYFDLSGNGYISKAQHDNNPRTTLKIDDIILSTLRPRASVNFMYLSVFLNSPVGQLQVAQRLHGSSGQIELYPDDIARFTIWLAPQRIQDDICSAVEQSFERKQRATQLLETAKRAVEIAIEESEKKAEAWLKEVGVYGE